MLTCGLLAACLCSLYFVAYAATGQPGGGPTGALVRQALAAIKRVDPDAWVVRLMLGLELADGVVRPSFMLGSKQEAMVSDGPGILTCTCLNGGTLDDACQHHVHCS